jgi:hypothetical protein
LRIDLLACLLTLGIVHLLRLFCGLNSILGITFCESDFHVPIFALPRNVALSLTTSRVASMSPRSVQPAWSSQRSVAKTLPSTVPRTFTDFVRFCGQMVEYFLEARFVRITHGGLAICFDPFGMLNPQVIVDLLPELGVGVDFDVGLTRQLHG